MKINVKKSSIIQPAQETPTHNLWISNLDLLVARIHFPTVYFYKSNGSDGFFEAQVLKGALSQVLVPFYPVAGRLRVDEESGRIQIDCNAEGVLFVEAETSCFLDDFCDDFTPRFEFQQLIPAVDYSCSISSYPLLVLQITYFKCGGISLGVGCHHTLADGLSALHFISAWARIARGNHMIIPTPFHDRTLLQAGNQPTPTFHHVEYDPSPSLDTPIPTPELDNPAAASLNPPAIFNIKPDQLNILRKKFSSFTTYEILAAHIWRCTCKTRELSGDQATKLYIATDGRSRSNPPLPVGYFGNALFTASPVAFSGDLQSEPFVNTMERIRRALKKMNDEYLRSAIDYLELQPDLSSLVRGPNAFASPNLNINSWMKLPVYEADFGWGRPVWMGPANVVYEGTVYVVPSPVKDGGLLLIVKVEGQKEVFKKLLYDFP